MQFNPFDFVQCFRRKVTFAAVRAAYHRHIFDDEQIVTFAVTSRNVTDFWAWLKLV